MNAVKTLRMPGLVALAVLASPMAMADDAGWYVGGNVGPSRAKIDDMRITDGLLRSGLRTTSMNDDEHGTGYKLFGGYQFNRYLSLEGGYFDLGKFGFTATTVPPGTLAGSIKVKGLNLDLVGTVPVWDRFAVFGRVGANYAQAKDSFSGSGAVTVLNPSPKKRHTDYKVGAGLAYAVTESLTVRAEAERYRVDDAVGNKGDIDLYSIGLVYRFGAKTPAAAPRGELPAPVASAPVPQVEAPPPPRPLPPPTRLTLSADALFDFGQATIKPSGTQSLDQFAADLKDARFDLVTVTGYSDRLGSHPYNMALSLRRAEAVKTYLLRAGIAASRVATKGVDGASPVTKPNECKGTKATSKLIACLQPDRRVEVEVSATK